MFPELLVSNEKPACLLGYCALSSADGSRPKRRLWGLISKRAAQHGFTAVLEPFIRGVQDDDALYTDASSPSKPLFDLLPNQ
jgi:hypothetical protein